MKYVDNPWKTDGNVSYISTFSSYREVNTFRLGYENKSVDATVYRSVNHNYFWFANSFYKPVQDRQFTENVVLMRVHITIFALGKQYVLHILSVLL